MKVQVTTPPAGPQIAAAVRTALVESAKPILEAAREGAPYEPVPRHGVHLRDTAYARLQAGQVGGTDRVAVGFTAFWAGWQHEHMDWHHDHGHAKYLELAVIGGAAAWHENLAELVRARLTG
mgnify:FL=1